MHLLVWDTECSDWKVCELMAMPFGAMGGVLAWWRVARVAQTAEQGKATFQTLTKTLGRSLDPNKSTPMATEVTSLECHLKITSRGVQWSLADAKQEKWMSGILRSTAAPDQYEEPAATRRLRGPFQRPRRCARATETSCSAA